MSTIAFNPLVIPDSLNTYALQELGISLADILNQRKFLLNGKLTATIRIRPENHAPVEAACDISAGHCIVITGPGDFGLRSIEHQNQLRFEILGQRLMPQSTNRGDNCYFADLKALVRVLKTE